MAHRSLRPECSLSRHSYGVANDCAVLLSDFAVIRFAAIQVLLVDLLISALNTSTMICVVPPPTGRVYGSVHHHA